MMWSQCRWDMNTWNVWPVGPRFAMTSLPKGRAPLPKSHTTYSVPPVSICTHDELPPNVYGIGPSRSTNSLICATVSSRVPIAFSSMVTSFCLTEADVMATGMDPRVPQNRISTRDLRLVELGQRRRGCLGDGVADGRRDREEHRE